MLLFYACVVSEVNSDVADHTRKTKSFSSEMFTASKLSFRVVHISEDTWYSILKLQEISLSKQTS